jgi:hypothetical protein
MASYGAMLVSVLILVSSCVGQDRPVIDSRATAGMIMAILGAAHVSGSLEFWGRCGPGVWQPDVPKMRELSDYSGSPREVLQRMFADDPKMRVTQEPGGTIRMVETDVPNDLLDVKISHISFRFHAPPNEYNGPNSALILILNTPEVKAFMKAHNIGPLGDTLPLPGNSGSGAGLGRRVYGELNNVTVAQALDYVLQIFPGIWIYQNCPGGEGGGRIARFNFY